ncbi:MAG: hypothetical protein J7L53_04680 [Deltaproteobacteria bacterium]|nr:hypothetical protein [Deltaproteobacteria bacterium]
MQMHHWDISIDEAFHIQKMIRNGVITKDKIGEIVHIFPSASPYRSVHWIPYLFHGQR